MTRKYKLKDYTGLEYKFIKVIERYNPSEEDTASTARWKILCACGNTTIVQHKAISSNKIRTCGCGMKTAKFLPGCKYGRLTIVGKPYVKKTSSRNIRFYPCLCSCGNPDIVRVRDYNLTSGNTTSCGCFGMESRITHGMSETPTYNTWEGIIRRCNPAYADDFPRYAGRGISVCERWHTFENFLEDMGERPDGMTLDRIDVNGNYCKDNCRWATNSIQGYNKPLDPNNTSGKSGVSFSTNQGKWSAEIHVNNEHIRLGMYTNFQDAVKAREEAELKYYGWNKE